MKFRLEYIARLPAGQPDLANDAMARRRWAQEIAERGTDPFTTPELVSADPIGGDKYRLIYVANLVDFAHAPHLESDASARKHWAQELAARGTKRPWPVPRFVEIREIAERGRTANDHAVAELTKLLDVKSWPETFLREPGVVDRCLKELKAIERAEDREDEDDEEDDDAEEKTLDQMSAAELRDIVETCGEAVKELHDRLRLVTRHFLRLRSSLDEGEWLPERWRRAKRQPKE